MERRTRSSSPSLEVKGTAPTEKLTVDLWAISGVSNSPVPIWADRSGRFFSVTSGIGWLPESYAGEQAKLEKAQTSAMAARSVVLAKELVKMPATPVVFAHVRLFDADAARFLADQTVVVDQGRIAAVGPASSTKVPANAQVIDGRNKTLVPGLWDCHMHVGDDYTGVQELSLGVTSVRDPGNDDLKTIDRRTRVRCRPIVVPSCLSIVADRRQRPLYRSSRQRGNH